MKLTEKEFETLIEALEQLPSKNMGSNLLMKLTVSAMFSSDEEARAKAEEELAKRQAEEELQQKEVKKACFVIAGKLSLMKDVIVEK